MNAFILSSYLDLLLLQTTVMRSIKNNMDTIVIAAINGPIITNVPINSNQ